MKILDMYNEVVGMLTALLAAVFGKGWYIFAAFLVFNILDWMTGWYKSRKLRTESSMEGLRGILKKLGYWVLIAVAFMVSAVFVNMGKDILHMDLGFMMMAGWFTIACLMVNEVRSILENLVECGYEVPEILIKGLAVTEKLICRDGDDDKVL